MRVFGARPCQGAASVCRAVIDLAGFLDPCLVDARLARGCGRDWMYAGSLLGSGQIVLSNLSGAVGGGGPLLGSHA